MTAITFSHQNETGSHASDEALNISNSIVQ